MSVGVFPVMSTRPDPGFARPWGRRSRQDLGLPRTVDVDEEVVSSARVHPNPGRGSRQPRGGGGAGLFRVLSRHRVFEVDDGPVGTGGRGFVEAVGAISRNEQQSSRRESPDIGYRAVGSAAASSGASTAEAIRRSQTNMLLDSFGLGDSWG